jgi:hypothetical protein
MRLSATARGIALTCLAMGIVVAAVMGWTSHSGSSPGGRATATVAAGASHELEPTATQPAVTIVEMPSSNVQKIQAEIDDLKRSLSESRTPPRQARAEPTPAEVDAWTEQTAQSFDERVKHELPDPKWRLETERRVADFLAHPDMAGVTSQSVDCRTSLCRIETSCKDSDARSRLFDRVSGLIPAGGEGFVHVQGPDDVEIQVYVSRDGPLL